VELLLNILKSVKNFLILCHWKIANIARLQVRELGKPAKAQTILKQLKSKLVMVATEKVRSKASLPIII
jgi:hypothetical protein